MYLDFFNKNIIWFNDSLKKELYTILLAGKMSWIMKVNRQVIAIVRRTETTWQFDFINFFKIA